MSEEKWLESLSEMARHYKDEPRVQHSVKFLRAIIKGKELQLPGNTNNVQSASLALPVPNHLRSENQVALYTDGGCLGNPGPGAWAAICQDYQGEMIFEASSFDAKTTNNKMEMQAVINGLINLIDHAEGKRGALEVSIFTDSKYVVDGSTQWMPSWKKNQWRKSDQKPPENLVLWQQLDGLLQDPTFIKVELNWVKGHAGHPQNEYCDRLCQNLLKQIVG